MSFSGVWKKRSLVSEKKPHVYRGDSIHSDGGFLPKNPKPKPKTKLQAYLDRKSSYIFNQNDKSFSASNTPSFLQLTSIN